MWWKKSQADSAPIAAPEATPAVTEAAGETPVSVDETPVSTRRTPVLRYAPAANHARMFLEWMQSAGGGTGYFPYEELEVAYNDAVIEHGLYPHPWAAVAGELRKLAPQPKRYVGKSRTRMWFIPPAAPELAAIDGQQLPRRSVS
jgi:hypothetical protein